MEALTMGGYGGYVWSAFGFALISMGGLLWQSWRAQARRTEELRVLRSTVRGGEGATERPPRRLVATKPDAVLGSDPAPARGPMSGSDGIAAPRSTSGT